MASLRGFKFKTKQFRNKLAGGKKHSKLFQLMSALNLHFLQLQDLAGDPGRRDLCRPRREYPF